MKELMQLFTVFARIGGLTFGGGYAMLPMIQEEIVEGLGWASEEEILDYYAIGQCTPGIIAVNTATFIGYKRRGVAGAIAATFGTVLPSVIIITLIAAFFRQFQHLALINHAFGGLRVAVTALILTSVTKMWKNSIVDRHGFFIFVVSFFVAMLTRTSPIFVVMVAAVAGITINNFRADAN